MNARFAPWLVLALFGCGSGAADAALAPGRTAAPTAESPDAASSSASAVQVIDDPVATTATPNGISNPNAARRNPRFGVRAPSSSSAPVISKQDSLRKALEAGLLGDPFVPLAPPTGSATQP